MPRLPTRPVLIALALSAGTASGQEPGTNVLKQGADLVWTEVSSGISIASLFGSPEIEGQAFAYRLDVPEGFEMAPHTHPVAEHITVISGELFVGLGTAMDRGAGKAYGPGSFIVIGPGEPAYMWSHTRTVVQVHGTGPLTTEYVGQPQEP